MTRETKAGLLMILMLGGVFGFMVYKRMQHPVAAMAQQITPEEESIAQAKESTDPFQTEETDRHPNRVVTAAATTPARMPEEDFAPAEPRAAKSSVSTKDSFEQFQSTNRSKPKLPTSLDDEFDTERKAPAKVETKHVPARVAEAARKEKEESFDPFSGDNSAPAETATETPTVANVSEADPFDTPAIKFDTRANDHTAEVTVQPKTNVAARNNESNDPFGDSTAESNDGFEVPVALKEAPREMERQRESDPFEAATDLEVQRPTKSVPKREEFTPPAETRREVILEEKQAEIAEFEVQVPSNSRQMSSPNAFDSLDAEPAKSSVPQLTIPSRDLAPTREPSPARKVVPIREAAQLAQDDRFGGFAPATAKDRTANAFEEHRPGVPAASSAPPVERRVARPAPVTQIDEDFRATAARPLVAGDTYDIEPGDNFWTISRKKYGTGRYFMALAQHNSQIITDPKRMKLGVSISTPAAEVLERTYAQFIPKAATIDPVQTASISPVVSSSNSTKVTVAAATDEAESGFFIADDGTPMYRIGREDTLSGVAQRHLGRSSRWTQIFELNRDVLPDGNSLKIGAVLRLPADASRVDVVERGRTFR
ncbi:MAG: Peptidoglycan-binding LysM [Schlesneria sp.]|nr:Peptidoglycan-binding LysM [Schlesneria sp.]